jgi:uncharacterized protein (TIGR03435 family)
MRQLVCASALLCAISAVAGIAHAQTAPAQPLSFDVVSIKPHTDEGMMMRIGFRETPDGFSANGASLDLLLRNAFNLSPDRILNEPDWAKSSRFDIEAKVAPEDAPRLKGLTRQQRWAMMIPVLQDRFGFKFHHETKDLEVYTLVVAKGGPRLKQADPAELAASAAPPAADKPGAPNALTPGQVKPGQMRMRMSPQGMSLEAYAGTIDALADTISQQIGSTVVDKTGLTGKYDYTLTFMPDEMSGPMAGLMRGAPPPDAGAQTQEPTGPSIFAALQEQLGLKLEAQKAPVDVIVIDHMERLSAN